ncbi:MAG: hypothetical protein DMF64_01275 [Acidobacteria bacterium]|nr:MAG: hypothetical protein DMF64_01275 [Acidobacteriota bacterium]
MNHPSKILRTFLIALSATSALFALWKFYLFVQFKNAAGQFDPQGGTRILWLAIAAALIACAAAAYLFFSAVNHDKEDVIHITS